MATASTGTVIGRLIALCMLAWLGLAVCTLSQLSLGLQGGLPAAHLITRLNKRDAEILCEITDVSLSVDYEPIGGKFSSGDQVTFSCSNESWTLIGPSVVDCLATGVWSDAFPACKYVTCTLPEIPPRGVLARSPLPSEPNDNATYSCEEDEPQTKKYELVGTRVRTCREDGQWHGDVPQCLVSCGELKAPANTAVHVQCTYVNCTADLACNMGFVFRNGRGETNSKLVCSESGTWTQAASECIAVTCNEPPDVPNTERTPDGEYSHGEYPYGAKLTYACQAGVAMVTDDEGGDAAAAAAETETEHSLTCDGNGLWVGKPPECKANDTDDQPLTPLDEAVVTPCPLPDQLPNGELRIYGKTLVYKCDIGYRLEGITERTCLSNTTWNGTAPVCVVNYTMTTTIITPKPFLWKQVFLDNKEWHGSYMFRGETFEFKLYILKVSVRTLSALLVDDLPIDLPRAKFDLEGSHSGENSLAFEYTRLLEPGERFPTNLTKWFVVGHLEKHSESGIWIYRGHIKSSVAGFGDLSMSPVQSKNTEGDKTADLLKVAESNVTAMALGVTIAIIAIAIAAALAAYCVTRKSGRGQGHRTLTSFENPVYEYENTLK